MRARIAANAIHNLRRQVHDSASRNKPAATSRRATIIIDLVAATGMIMSMLTVFALAMSQFVNTSGTLFTRQRAAMAAESILNELRAGHTSTDEEISSRFKGMRAEIRRTPGDGPWKGMTHVSVVIHAAAEDLTPVRIRMSTYIPEATP